MKMMKKLLTAAAVLLIGCAGAFAFDASSAMIEEIDEMSRDDFYEIMEDDDFLEAMVEAMAEEGVNISQIAKIESDDADEDDMAAYQWSLKQIQSERPSGESVYMTFALDETDEESGTCTGWMIFSHYVDRNDIDSYVYYFEATF